MNKASQPLHRAPSFPLSAQIRDALLVKWQIDVLQSLKALRPGFWEDSQFNNTSKLASRGSWVCERKRGFRVSEEKKKKRERENNSIERHTFCRTSRADLQRWWRMWVSRRKGEIQRAEEHSHVHHHLFVYIQTANHLVEQRTQTHPSVSQETRDTPSFIRTAMCRYLFTSYDL